MDASAVTLPFEVAASSVPASGTAIKPKAKKGKDKEPGAPIKRRKKSEKNAAATTTALRESEGVETGSRSGSIAPNQASLGIGGSGGNTPTKRKPSGKTSRAKTSGQRGSTRQDSRGSRGTSARASTSVAPGQQRSGTQPQQEEDEEYVNATQQPEEDDDIEDDDDEEEGAGAGQGLEEEEWQRQEAIQKARSKAMAPLMKAMDEVQQDRYSAYRTSFLDKRHVKRIIFHLTGQNTTKQVNTLTAGMARIFVGEIVESARKVQEAKGEAGPLRPEHLLEAQRLYKEEREVPGRYPPGAPSSSAGVAGNGKRRRLF